MERILIGIDASNPSWDALTRALCLGPRIQARVSVLAVFSPGAMDKPAGQELLHRIEAAIEASEGSANVELFVAQGRFEQAVIEAVRELKTTLLVAAAAGEDQAREGEAERLGRILHGVDCRVELVSPRRNLQRKKDGK